MYTLCYMTADMCVIDSYTFMYCFSVLCVSGLTVLNNHICMSFFFKCAHTDH